MSQTVPRGNWWFIFQTDSDNSLALIAEKNIVQPASAKVEAGDKAKYIYNGKFFHGEVLDLDPDYDAINIRLNAMVAKRKQAKKSAGQHQLPTNPSGGRSSRVTKPVVDSSTQPPAHPLLKKPVKAPTMSQEEKKRLDQISKRKREAQSKQNDEIHVHLQASGTLTDLPLIDSPHSSDSDVDIGSRKNTSKNLNSALLRNLKESLEDDDTNTQPSNTNDSACEVLALKEKVASLEAQLLSARNTPELKETDGNGSSVPGKDNDPDHEDVDLSGSDPFNGIDSRLHEKSISLDGSDSLDNLMLDIDEDMDEALEYQLYGKTNKSKELAFNIHCDKVVLGQAVAGAFEANHVARRLMHGVFKPSRILDATVSGRSWNAAPEGRKRDSVKPLHRGAVRAICAFANAVAKKRKQKELSIKKLKAAMGGRLVEIKRSCKNGSLKDFVYE